MEPLANDPSPKQALNKAESFRSPAGLEMLRRAAFYGLLDNTQVHTFGDEKHKFSVPSLEKYPFQWFWDSCFHAIVWSHYDTKRAKQEINSLLTGQRDDGFLPHIIYWDEKKLNLVPWSNHWSETLGRFSFLPFANKPKHSELIQPPLIAQAVERICLADNFDYAQEVLPKLNKYYSWLKETRDPDRDHLISIVSPYESGIDGSPAYDKPIGYKSIGPYALPLARFKVLFLNSLLFNYDQKSVVEKGPFHVEDVLVNSIYALNLQSLARLNKIAGNVADADKWQKEAEAVRDALISECWDERRGAFFNRNGRGKGELSSVLTIQSLMPIILPDLPKEIVDRVVKQHLLNPKEFWTNFPVPSVAANEPTYAADSKIKGEVYPGLWRGSSWVNTNWYLAQALSQHGYVDEAAMLASKSIQMVSKSGMYEYFNAETGAGLGARRFGWSTLVVDMIKFLRT